MRFPLSLTILLVGCTLTSTAALAAPPTRVETLIFNEVPRHISISPTGNRMLVTNDAGVWEYALRPDGTVGARKKGIAKEFVSVAAYTPNGRRIVYVSSRQICILDRQDWDPPVAVFEFPFIATPTLHISDNPALAVVQDYNSTISHIFNWDRQPEIKATVEHDDLGIWKGRGAFLAPGGQTLYGLYARTEPPGIWKLEAYYEPLGAANPVWDVSITEPWAWCVGPDPQHIAVANNYTGGVSLYNLGSGERRAWVELNAALPAAMAMTPDGYYLATCDRVYNKLTIMSGHDLRGLMDPNLDMRSDDVRKVVMDLPREPLCIAVHPELPLAYVGLGLITDEGGGAEPNLMVIRLGIPGVDHPSDP